MVGRKFVGRGAVRSGERDSREKRHRAFQRFKPPAEGSMTPFTGVWDEYQHFKKKVEETKIETVPFSDGVEVKTEEEKPNRGGGTSFEL